jgi:hypothetical protein
MVEVLDNEQNLLLKHKFRQRTLEIMLPVLTRIIDEGIREGVFNVHSPRETALYIIASGHTLSDFTGRLLLKLKANPESLEELKNLLLVYERSIQGVLGITGAHIDILDQSIFEKLKEF